MDVCLDALKVGLESEKPEKQAKIKKDQIPSDIFDTVDLTQTNRRLPPNSKKVKKC
jgi:hypothetical protein